MECVSWQVLKHQTALRIAQRNHVKNFRLTCPHLLGDEVEPRVEGGREVGQDEDGGQEDRHEDHDVVGVGADGAGPAAAPEQPAVVKVGQAGGAASDSTAVTPGNET